MDVAFWFLCLCCPIELLVWCVFFGWGGDTTSANATLCDTFDAIQNGVDLTEKSSGPLLLLASVIWPEVIPEEEEISFGVEQLLTIARMGVAKFSAEEACAKGEEFKPESVESESVRVLDSCTTDGKQIFTSTPPSGLVNESKCITYPSEATFCADLGHSHRVVGSFTDANFASLRDTDVRLAWSQVSHTDVIAKFRHVSDVCINSVKDALCLDAFPMCNEQDLTPCMMSCRNVLTCFDELFHIRYGDLLQKHVQTCQDACKEAIGINKVINFKKLERAFDVTGDVSSLEPKQGAVLVLLALVISMVSVTFCARQHRVAVLPQE